MHIHFVIFTLMGLLWYWFFKWAHGRNYTHMLKKILPWLLHLYFRNCPKYPSVALKLMDFQLLNLICNIQISPTQIHLSISYCEQTYLFSRSHFIILFPKQKHWKENKINITVLTYEHELVQTTWKMLFCSNCPFRKSSNHTLPK